MKDISLKNTIRNIPEDFFSKSSFFILMAACFTLPITMIYIAIFDNTIQEFCILIVETFSLLLVALYIAHKSICTQNHNAKNLFNFQIWDFLFLALLIWSGISTLLAEDLTFALIGTVDRCEGFIMYLKYASIYICGRLITSSSVSRRLITTYGICISLLSVMTFIQAIPGLHSALGIFSYNPRKFLYVFACVKYAAIYQNINHYAYVLNMAVLALAGLYLISQGWKKYLFLALFCFNTWALVINNTFGCYLGSMFGLIFLVILITIRNKQALKPSLLLISLFFIVSIFTSVTNDGILLDNFINIYNEIFGSDNLFDNGSAGSGRIDLWNQAFKYISEKPIFGHGPEGLHLKYYADGFSNDRPHNEYIQYAAFTGIPSLLFYLGALISLLVYCLKNLKKLTPELTVVGGIIFAYCVSAFFGNTRYTTSLYFFMFIGLLSNCHHNKIQQT